MKMTQGVIAALIKQEWVDAKGQILIESRDYEIDLSLSKTKFKRLSEKHGISRSPGHASIGITLDTYSHIAPGLQEAAADRFDELVPPRREKEAVEKFD